MHTFVLWKPYFSSSLGLVLCRTRFVSIFLLWPAGPLSSIWKEWIKWCIEFGIEANAIIAVPYDWRLSPSMLEERDLYFHKLKCVDSTQCVSTL